MCTETAFKASACIVLCEYHKLYVCDRDAFLTRREQEIPHLYRWWDELR